MVLLDEAKRAAAELKDQLEESLILGESSSRTESLGSLNDDLDESCKIIRFRIRSFLVGKQEFPKDILEYFAEHETEIKMYIEKTKNAPTLPTIPDTVVPTVPTSSIPTSPKRVLRQDSQPDIIPEAIPLVFYFLSFFLISQVT